MLARHWTLCRISTLLVALLLTTTVNNVFCKQSIERSVNSATQSVTLAAMTRADDATTAAAAAAATAATAAAAAKRAATPTDSTFGLSLGFSNQSVTPTVCEFSCGQSCSYHAPCGFDMPENKPGVEKGKMRVAMVLLDKNNELVPEGELKPNHMRKLHVTITHEDHIAAFWHASPAEFGGIKALASIFWVDVWFPFGGFYDINVYFEHQTHGAQSVSSTVFVAGPQPPTPEYDQDRGLTRHVLPSALRKGGVFPFFVLRSVSQLNPSEDAATGYEVRMLANNGDPIHKQQCVQLQFSAVDKKSGKDTMFTSYYGAAFHVIAVPHEASDVGSGNEPKAIRHLFGFASKTEAAQHGCKPQSSEYAGTPRLGPTLAVNVALDEGMYDLIVQLRPSPSLQQEDTDVGDLITAVFQLDVLGAPFHALPVPLLVGDDKARINKQALRSGANYVSTRVRFLLDSAHHERFYEIDLSAFCDTLPAKHISCAQAIRQFSLDVWLERDDAVFESDDNMNADKIPAWAAQAIEMRLSSEADASTNRQLFYEAMQAPPWEMHVGKFIVRVSTADAQLLGVGATFLLRVALRRTLLLEHGQSVRLVFSDEESHGGVDFFAAQPKPQADGTVVDYFGPSPYLTRFMTYYGSSHPSAPADVSTEQMHTPRLHWTATRWSVYAEFEACMANNKSFAREACLVKHFDEIATDFGASSFPTCLANMLEENGAIDSCQWLAENIGFVMNEDGGPYDAIAACPRAGTSQYALCNGGCQKGVAISEMAYFLEALDGSPAKFRKRQREPWHGPDQGAEVQHFSYWENHVGQGGLNSAIRTPAELQGVATKIQKLCHAYGTRKSEQDACHSAVGGAFVRAGIDVHTVTDLCPKLDELSGLTENPMVCKLGAIDENIQAHLGQNEKTVAAALPAVCNALLGSDLHEACYNILAEGLLLMTSINVSEAMYVCTLNNKLNEETCSQHLADVLRKFQAKPSTFTCNFDRFYSRVELRTQPLRELNNIDVGTLAGANIPWSMYRRAQAKPLDEGTVSKSMHGATPSGSIDAQFTAKQRQTLVDASKGHGKGVFWIYYASYSPQGALHPMLLTLDDPYPGKTSATPLDGSSSAHAAPLDSTGGTAAYHGGHVLPSTEHAPPTFGDIVQPIVQNLLPPGADVHHLHLQPPKHHWYEKPVFLLLLGFALVLLSIAGTVLYMRKAAENKAMTTLD